MKYRALAESGDSTFGRQLFLTAREAVAQAIVTRLRLLYGEWWENTADGLPLFEQILGAYGGEAAREAVDLIISERIQGTTNVTRLVSYASTFDVQTREYDAQCVVDTAFGELELRMTQGAEGIEVTY